MRSIRVAVIGAGPAGIYAADILANEHPGARIDVFDRLPAPYGLVRYGVAPDHPRIKEIIKALRRVLSREEIRFIGNVNYGADIKLTDLRRHYDAVIFATGARKDRPLDIPGIDLPGSYGAADFVSWYDGHPDVPRDWPLQARHVAVQDEPHAPFRDSGDRCIDHRAEPAAKFRRADTADRKAML